MIVSYITGHYIFKDTLTNVEWRCLAAYELIEHLRKNHLLDSSGDELPVLWSFKTARLTIAQYQVE